MFTCALLMKIVKYDKIYYRLYSTMLKLSVELDTKINEEIVNKELKFRKHEGIVRVNCVKMPDILKKAIEKVLGDTPRDQLLKECKSFVNYLKSREAPVDRKRLFNKKYAIKREVEDYLNVNKEMLNPEEKESYNEVVGYFSDHVLKQRVYNWKAIFFTRHLGLQYLLARAPAEYAVLFQIFHEIKARDNFVPKTLFDFGSGVGSVVWAANETWSNSFMELFCVDSSKDMNDISEKILQVYNKNFTNKMFFRQFLPSANDPTYDMVVSAYSLIELPSLKSRLDTVSKLWEKTSKYLILVEQGTKAGFSLITEARDHILNISKENESTHCHIFSPCPHDEKCPKLSTENQPACNFEVPYLYYLKKNLAMKEIYSYVVISKGQREANDKQWPRIIKPVLRPSKRAICRLCTKSGDLKEVIFTKAKHGPTSYKCAKVCNWGDRLPFNFKTSSTEEIAEIAEDQSS